MYKNILVHSLVNLGDVLLSTSAVALLKKMNPESKITMMVRPAMRQLLENNPVVDEVIIFDYKGSQKSIGAMWAFVGELKKRQFDLCISFDRKLRPAIITWLARIPVRVCPDRVFDDVPSRVTMLYTQVIHVPHDIVNNLQAETYQAIVRGFFKIEGHAKPVMALPTATNEAKVAGLLVSLPETAKKIGLCVKGTFPLKTWPKEYFARLVELLDERYDAAFFIIGAPEDREYADEVIAAGKVKPANFCGRTSLTDMVPLYHAMDLFVTVDTGATHIAATTDVPMVVMYGCTSPKRWHPMNENSRVLTTEEDCCPCKIAAEECPKPKCLWNIKPEAVLEKCAELLAKE